MAHTWDNSGNLLNDGVYTYTYDMANHLIAAGGAVAYRYNGLGERLQETRPGATITYTVDLQAGLSQVLSDGAHTYLYGNGRIAQQDAAGRSYLLGDALGSVRQVVNAQGVVTLARSYAPYGEVRASSGEGASSYGFTGEWQEASRVYLRARWYSPGSGRFLTRDSWEGDDYAPMSYNAWVYGYANPVLFLDPSGNCADWDHDGNCENYDEKRYPSGVLFTPLSDPLHLGAGGIPYGVNQAQFKIKSSWTGLCGPISVAAIVRSRDYSVIAKELVDKAQGLYGDPNNLSPIGLTSLTEQFIYENYQTHWVTDWGYITQYLTNESKDYRSEKGQHEVKDHISTWLKSSKLIIVGVLAGHSTGKIYAMSGVSHWVVITGISNERQVGSGNWVRVYNPFDNETEYYPWEDFGESWRQDGSMTVIISTSELRPRENRCQ